MDVHFESLLIIDGTMNQVQMPAVHFGKYNFGLMFLHKYKDLHISLLRLLQQ